MTPRQTFGALLLAVLAVAVSFVLLAVYVPAAPSAPIVATPAQLKVSGAETPVSAAFYGVGIQVGTPLSSDTASLLSGTPIHYIRFPDGKSGDRMDLVNGTLYTPGEANATQPAVTLPDFISACEAIDCQAIIQLPLEIDSPGTAAYEVNYIENSLHFDPAYFELGNEPGGWTCYGTPWADWGSGCTGGTDPTTYAQEVGTYISAVRAVDPSAQFVGLGGTGSGNSNDSSWIAPLEEEDGHNLAAISIHSYVDDHIPSPDTVTLSNFFTGLSSPSSIPNILTSARQAVRAACPTCSTQVFVTEMDAVSGGQPLGSYLPTFYNGVFFAAEVTQGLNFQASNIDPFTWESEESGLITSSGPAARYTVESAFLSRLGPDEFNATVNISGVYVAVTGGNGSTELLLVNTNTSTSVNVLLTSSGLGLSGVADLWTWTSSESSPSESTPSAALLSSILLPPMSVELVTASGSPNGVGFPSPLSP
ncbi:MAG: hypothetical protein ABR888_07695 [Thermoplasmata archaeon]|jgi:hypothetical protein